MNLCFFFNFNKKRNERASKSIWNTIARNLLSTKDIFKTLRNRLVHILVSIGLLASDKKNKEGEQQGEGDLQPVEAQQQ